METMTNVSSKEDPLRILVSQEVKHIMEHFSFLMLSPLTIIFLLLIVLRLLNPTFFIIIFDQILITSVFVYQLNSLDQFLDSTTPALYSLSLRVRIS